MNEIEWEQDNFPVDYWERKSKDGQWSLQYKRKADGTESYWLYNYKLMMGAYVNSLKTAKLDFIESFRKHIEKEKEYLAQLEKEVQE